ncbi:MAG TPA: serine dehydratase beta chain, partial [Candidatus Baltobacteraceae bacterium]|nr:serine dehydratase beta chain [Candidatus Baltobacteraceae bacterium]
MPHISVFDLFKVGLGPSSSHTVGPMRAALHFAGELSHRDLLPCVHRVAASLYGSLALTGKGHATDTAVQLGLEGNAPDTTGPDFARDRPREIAASRVLRLNAAHEIRFDPERDIIWRKSEVLHGHANGMRIEAFDAPGNVLFEQTYYS